MYSGLRTLGRCAARDFAHAKLAHAKLTGADLTDAYLAGAYLAHAKLAHAKLTGADFTGANLTHAKLTGADLAGAKLDNARLDHADFTNADLTGTCLDPNAPIPAISDADILAAGLTIEGAYVDGWRTRVSKHAGNTMYSSGQTYTAPWFSVARASCHPGLYLASLEWLDWEDYDGDRVRVRCMRTDLHKAGDKWRCRRLEVL